MCVSKEHFNLCKCGCPEIDHAEANPGAVILHQQLGWDPPARGKCRGRIPIKMTKRFVEKLKEAKEQKKHVPTSYRCRCEKFEQSIKVLHAS